MNKSKISLILAITLLGANFNLAFALPAEQLPPGLNDPSVTTPAVTPADAPVPTLTSVSPSTTLTELPANTTTTTPVKSTPAFQDFKDVPVTHPYYNAIIVLRYQGLLNGYADNTFRPDQEINRAEALKLIFEVAKIDIATGIAPVKFKDTDETSWYAGYLNKAVYLEVANGYADGTFKPEKNVNLVEFLKMLEIAQKVDLSKTDLKQLPYTDVAPGQWYSKYINYAKINALVDVDKDGKVYPEKALTRGRVSEILYRFRNMKNKDQSVAASSTTVAPAPAASTTFSPEKDFALYVSATHKFAIQYPKKWFYSSLDNTDKTAIRTYGYGPKDLSLNAPVITLELLPDSATYKADLIYKNVSYFKDLKDNGHITVSAKIEGSTRIYRLTGPAEQETTMLNMLNTLTTDIAGLETTVVVPVAPVVVPDPTPEPTPAP